MDADADMIGGTRCSERAGERDAEREEQNPLRHSAIVPCGMVMA
jgi:hypothetical protein